MAGSTRSYELARRLAQAGHTIHMLTTDRDDNSTSSRGWRKSNESGITVHWVRVPYSNSMTFGERLRAFARYAFMAAKKAVEIDADLIFATSTPLTVALPGLYASKRRKIPLVFEVRDLWPDVPIALGAIRNPIVKAAAKWLERAAYRGSTQIVALAPGMKEEIVAKGVDAERVTVIPNGCDLDLFAEAARDVPALRSSHEWLSDRPLVAYIGTIGRINAVDFLVDVARLSLTRSPDIRFAVVGAGIETEKVRAKAQRAGVLNRNFFMLGQMSKREAAVWTAAATINVALVRGPRFIWKDATQNKYFDSLAAGRPVLSNYDGWQAEITTSAGAGIIVGEDDAEEAASRLSSAVYDKAWLRSASKAAFELSRNEYSRDRHARQLEGVLDSALNLYKQ